MASEVRSPSVAQAVFLPYRLLVRTILALVLLWLAATAVHATWVHAKGLEVDAYMVCLIGQTLQPRTLTEVPALEWMTGPVFRWIDWLSTPSTSLSRSGSIANTLQGGVSLAFRDILVIAAYETLLVAARLMRALDFAPAYALVMSVMLADGWAERSIRKACAGLESAAIYHRAKRVAFDLMIPAVAVAYLCWPCDLNPSWPALALTLLSGWLVRTQAKYYKKHL